MDEYIGRTSILAALLGYQGDRKYMTYVRVTNDYNGAESKISSMIAIASSQIDNLRIPNFVSEFEKSQLGE